MIGPNGPMYAGGGLGPRHHTGLGMPPPAGGPSVVTANAMAAAKAGAAAIAQQINAVGPLPFPPARTRYWASR